MPYLTTYAIDLGITLASDYMSRVSAMGDVQGRGSAKLVHKLGKKPGRCATSLHTPNFLVP